MLFCIDGFDGVGIDDRALLEVGGDGGHLAVSVRLDDGETHRRSPDSSCHEFVVRLWILTIVADLIWRDGFGDSPCGLGQPVLNFRGTKEHGSDGLESLVGEIQGQFLAIISKSSLGS